MWVCLFEPCQYLEFWALALAAEVWSDCLAKRSRGLSWEPTRSLPSPPNRLSGTALSLWSRSWESASRRPVRGLTASLVATLSCSAASLGHCFCSIRHRLDVIRSSDLHLSFLSIQPTRLVEIWSNCAKEVWLGAVGGSKTWEWSLMLVTTWHVSHADFGFLPSYLIHQSNSLHLNAGFWSLYSLVQVRSRGVWQCRLKLAWWSC